MPVFDGTLVAAAFGLIGALIGGIFAYEKGNSPNRFIAAGITILVLILGLCGLAWHYRWESDILNIHSSSESVSSPEANADQNLDADANVDTPDGVEPTDSTDDAENSSEDTITDDISKLHYEIFDTYQGTTYTIQHSDGENIAMVYCGSVTFPERDYSKKVYLYCVMPENEDESSVRSVAYVFTPISYGAEYREGNQLYKGGWYLISSSGGGAYLYIVQTIDGSDQ